MTGLGEGILTDKEIVRRLSPEDYFTADLDKLSRTLDSFAPVFAMLTVHGKPNCGTWAEAPNNPYYGRANTEDQVIGCSFPVRAVASDGDMIPVMAFEALKVASSHHRSLEAITYAFVEEGSPGTYPEGNPEWRANLSFVYFRPDCGEFAPMTDRPALIR